MKGDKPMTVQTSLRNLLQKPSLLVDAPRARKGRGGGGRKEKERKEDAKVLPATTQASKDTPKRKISQLRRKHQGHPREKEGEERKQRKKERKKDRKKERKTEREREREREGGREREREREREGKNEKGPTNKPGTHQRERGVILSIPFRNTPEGKEGSGEGRGRRGGAKCSADSNEP